ncbi:hypothetical protein HDU85_003293 [Gaertneriomyces sp. JEL0708]|nr:hypothetical protein HDU85_003293 [Gaertneriomyces sp. JEL0708]
MPRPEQRMYTAPHRSRTSSAETPTTPTHPPHTTSSPHAWETSVGVGSENESGRGRGGERGVKKTVGRGKTAGGNTLTSTPTSITSTSTTTTDRGMSNVGQSKPRIVHAWETVDVGDGASPATTTTTAMKSQDRKNGHASGDDRHHHQSANVRHNVSATSNKSRNGSAGHGMTHQRRSTSTANSNNNNNKAKTATTTRTAPDIQRVTTSNVGDDHPSVGDTLSAEGDSDSLGVPHDGTNNNSRKTGNDTRKSVADTREPVNDTRRRGGHAKTSDWPRGVGTTATTAGSRPTRQPIRFPTAEQEWDGQLQNHSDQGGDSGSGFDDDLEIDDFFTPRPHHKKQPQHQLQKGDNTKHATHAGQGRDNIQTSERTRKNGKGDDRSEQDSEAGEILNPYLPIPSRHHHQQQQGSPRRPGSASSPHRYAHTPPRNSSTPPRNSYTPPRNSYTPPRHTPSTRSLSPHSWTPSSSHSLTNNTTDHNNKNKNHNTNKYLAVPQDIHIPISVSEPSYSKNDHPSSAHTTPPATPPSPSILSTTPHRTDASQHKLSHTDPSHTEPSQNTDSQSHTTKPHEPSKSPQKPWASLVTGSWADDDGDIDYEVIPVWKPGGTK